jgi:hypothetical protein
VNGALMTRAKSGLHWREHRLRLPSLREEAALLRLPPTLQARLDLAQDKMFM